MKVFIFAKSGKNDTYTSLRYILKYILIKSYLLTYLLTYKYLIIDYCNKNRNIYKYVCISYSMIKKINKTITISKDVNENLKNVKNASILIDGLLRKHFEMQDLKKLSSSELRQKLEKIEKKEALTKELNNL